MFNEEKTLARVYAPDRVANPIARWADVLWMAVSLGAPALCGWVLGGSFDRALPALIVAGVFRICLFQHATWCINSICNWLGTRPYRTNDQSTNNPLLGVIVLGEGWHNNHHAFPTSARHGLESYQVDLTWIALRVLAALGLAWNLKAPLREKRARLKRSQASRRFAKAPIEKKPLPPGIVRAGHRPTASAAGGI